MDFKRFDSKCIILKMLMNVRTLDDTHHRCLKGPIPLCGFGPSPQSCPIKGEWGLPIINLPITLTLSPIKLGWGTILGLESSKFGTEAPF